MTAATTEFERAGPPVRRALHSNRGMTGCLVLVNLAAARDREVVHVPGWLRFPA
jgi:hypothetical protein